MSSTVTGKATGAASCLMNQKERQNFNQDSILDTDSNLYINLKKSTGKIQISFPCFQLS